MPTQREFLSQVLLGDAAAIAFVEAVGAVTQVWDDLVDGDKPVPPEDVNRAFWEALVAIPNNPFYRAHFDTLNPLLQAAIVDWFDANVLERGSEQDKRIAFVLRDSTASLVVHCARLVGGYDWMRKVGPEIRRYFLDETFEDYVKERG